jgi:hypothetical protein
LTQLLSEGNGLGGGLFAQAPGAELEGGEIEPPGENRDSSDQDDDEADPTGEPVFLPEEVRPV